MIKFGSPILINLESLVKVSEIKARVTFLIKIKIAMSQRNKDILEATRTLS